MFLLPGPPEREVCRHSPTYHRHQPTYRRHSPTSLPGRLFILSCVPLLPRLCSYGSVDMSILLWNLADVWAAMSYISLPLSYVSCSLHPSIQLSSRICCMSLFMWYSLDLLSWGPPFIFRLQKNSWGPALASYSGTSLLFKKIKIAFSPTSGTLIFSKLWIYAHILPMSIKHYLRRDARACSGYHQSTYPWASSFQEI